MRLLFDTNVVLDLLLDREPWARNAARLFTRVETGAVDGALSATTLTTIFYLARKIVGTERARERIRQLLALCSVAPVNRPVLETAIELDFTDFEDAVIHESARQASVEAIVTRNPGDFKNATLSVLTPEECVGILEQRERQAEAAGD